MQSQLYRHGWRSRAFDGLIIAILAVIGALTAYPLVYTVVLSLGPAYVPNQHFYLWPNILQVSAYGAVLKNQLLLRSFFNSALYTSGSALFSVALTITTAYPLSIRSFPFRNFFMFLITFTLIFSGGLIPYYFVVKGLGLVNTPWAMIVPGSLSAFNVILARTYLQETIPAELREAARVDGANDWTILVRIVYPLALPIVAVVALFTAVSTWNAYFPALLFLNNENLYPVAMVLRDIVVGASTTNAVPPELAGQVSVVGVQAATLVLATVPIVCVYPFVQRYFTRGIMIGAIKG